MSIIYKTSDNTYVDMSQLQEVRYRRKTLWGLFSWWVEVSSKKARNDLYIITNESIDKIYLNGELLEQSRKK